MLCGDQRNKLRVQHGIAWVLWHRSIAWNPSVCQVRAPKLYFPQMRINSFDRRTVQCNSTLNSTTVPGRQSTHTSHMHTAHPTRFTRLSFFFLSTFPSPLSSLISFFFFLFFFWIGLIPCSLACPIIFWNIQGNVSSCCHSNYSNIQHGSWLSSFWKCFSFLSRSSVTREGCRLFKGICSKLAQKRDNTAKGERGETRSKLEWST